MFWVKTIVAAMIISFASWLAGRKPVLAGFIIALPMGSFLAILFAYWQYRDMAKINEFATSILVAVPVSLVFFIPFILNRWLHMNFLLTMALAIGLLFVAYLIHTSIFRSI